MTIPGDLVVGTSLTVAGDNLLSFVKTSALTTLLADKANVADPVFYGSVTTPAVTLNGADLQGLINQRAPTASPTFTGTVTAGIIKASDNLNFVTSTGTSAFAIYPDSRGTIFTRALSTTGAFTCDAVFTSTGMANLNGGASVTDLSVSGQLVAKPYVGLRLVTDFGTGTFPRAAAMAY